MQAEIQIKFNDIDNALNILKKHFNWELSLNRIIELDKLIETENFWNDTSTAQSIMKEKKQLDKIIELLKLIEIEKSNLFELIHLAEEENDKELIEETIFQIDGLVKKCDKLQLESLLSGEADANNDNEITAGELHSYVQANVIQQSSGSQTPELQGNADRVLVRFQ